MVKKHINILVEAETWNKLNTYFPRQLGNKINDYLHRLLLHTESNTLGYDIYELKKKEEKLTGKITEFTAELEDIRQKQEILKQQQEKEEEEEVERQKKEAEELSKCGVCGIPKKPEEMSKVAPKVCKNCFLTGDTQTLRKYVQMGGTNANGVNTRGILGDRDQENK